MAAAESDDESFGDIPFKKPETKDDTMPRKGKGGKGKGKAVPDPVEEVVVEGAEDEDDDIAEDEYAVEGIVSHLFEPNGTLKFEVKWVGYDKKHNTWEPEENLDGAQDELATYYEEIGGKPAFGTAKSRKSLGLAEKSGAGTGKTSKATTTTASKKRAAESSPVIEKPESRRTSRVPKKAKTDDNGPKDDSTTNGDSGKPTSSDGKVFSLPKGSSWEDEINEVESISKDTDGSGGLVGTVKWRNGSVTQHKVKVLYARCPQRMLKFYESHLQFKYTDPVQYPPAAERDPETEDAAEATSNAAIADTDKLLETVGEGMDYIEEGIKGVASTIQKSAASMVSAVKDAVTHNTPKAATPKAVATKAGTPASAAVKSVQALKTVLNGEADKDEGEADEMDTDET